MLAKLFGVSEEQGDQWTANLRGLSAKQHEKLERMVVYDQNRVGSYDAWTYAQEVGADCGHEASYWCALIINKIRVFKALGL